MTLQCMVQEGCLSCSIEFYFCGGVQFGMSWNCAVSTATVLYLAIYSLHSWNCAVYTAMVLYLAIYSLHSWNCAVYTATVLYLAIYSLHSWNCAVYTSTVLYLAIYSLHSCTVFLINVLNEATSYVIFYIIQYGMIQTHISLHSFHREFTRSQFNIILPDMCRSP